VDSPAVDQLRQQIEPLAVLSVAHLSASTRTGLARNQLSVNAYSTEFGGFVYVGRPAYSVPVETDLARIFEIASAAGAVWLKFDIDAAVIDGLPLFDELAP
jgi:hypothetical protein